MAEDLVISVAFDRAALSLGTLTITEDFSETYWLPTDVGLAVQFSNRKTTSPGSPYLSGRTLLARVRDMGSISLVVYAQGATTSALETAKAAFDAAVDQWAYDLTVTVDGAALSLNAECVDTLPTWGDVDPGMVRAKIARGSVVIPLYPS